MKTVHSIVFASALFATFMALGMEKMPLVRQVSDSGDCSFVQDRENLRLMLLYHSPVRGAMPAPCGSSNAPASSR